MTTVQLSTFLSWGLTDFYRFKTHKEQGKEVVSLLWCKICAKYPEAVEREPTLRGKAKADAHRFITGTDHVTKSSVTRHLDGKVSCLTQYCSCS